MIRVVIRVVTLRVFKLVLVVVAMAVVLLARDHALEDAVRHVLVAVLVVVLAQQRAIVRLVKANARHLVKEDVKGRALQVAREVVLVVAKVHVLQAVPVNVIRGAKALAILGVKVLVIQDVVQHALVAVRVLVPALVVIAVDLGVQVHALVLA